jgi:NAD(P)-dependent dehydrogenase (short-subunit alcohol dehydrogenase family)
MSEARRFEGKVAVVTGAASGIGHATAVRLAREGAAIAVVDVDEEGAHRTCDEIKVLGSRAHPVIADVADPTQVHRALQDVTSLLGIPRVLVNNAGILRLATVLETSDDLFEQVLRTNLYGFFYFSRDFARALIGHELTGTIVNVSSIHAVLSEPNGGAYTAAKGGVEAMSRTMASEWARLGIRVNCVRPGATHSALSKPIYTEEVVRALGMRIPLGTIAEPEQIAAGICFLASEEAGYITGTTLDIDGGYIMDGSLPGLLYRD